MMTFKVNIPASRCTRNAYSCMRMFVCFFYFLFNYIFLFFLLVKVLFPLVAGTFACVHLSLLCLSFAGTSSKSDLLLLLIFFKTLKPTIHYTKNVHSDING